jgi:carbamoyltransferase
MLHLCGTWGEKVGLRRVAMAGGVALNCTANGKLLNSGRFDEIYIQPAAGDDGIAVGAALWAANQAGEVTNRRSPVPFLGPGFTDEAVDAALAEFADRITARRFASFEETCAEAARRIADGQVLAWYRGRMEFGPRALGHRSILADPGHPEMRDRINAMVKKREGFRPFAPAVSLAQASRWFDVAPGVALPYMTVIVDVREEHRAALPAITHVDGTARVQTVSPEDNREFHTLLEHVGRTTGREMVLNTSFNVKGQPIVNTPSEAIDTYLNTGMDCLFVGDWLIERA